MRERVQGVELAGLLYSNVACVLQQAERKDEELCVCQRALCVLSAPHLQRRQFFRMRTRALDVFALRQTPIALHVLLSVDLRLHVIHLHADVVHNDSVVLVRGGELRGGGCSEVCKRTLRPLLLQNQLALARLQFLRYSVDFAAVSATNCYEIEPNDSRCGTHSATISDMSEFSMQRDSSAGLLLSKRVEIHSLEDKGRRRLDEEGEGNAGDDEASAGVRGRLAESVDGERLERGECNLRFWGDWASTSLFM